MMGMTPHPNRHVRAPSATMLRWVLQRDRNAITCELDARGGRSYELCVVPHWNPSAAVIERFETPTSALLRHAEVAHHLRQGGWLVVDRVIGRVHAAA
jgi:hypothetical protein